MCGWVDVVWVRCMVPSEAVRVDEDRCVVCCLLVSVCNSVWIVCLVFTAEEDVFGTVTEIGRSSLTLWVTCGTRQRHLGASLSNTSGVACTQSLWQAHGLVCRNPAIVFTGNPHIFRSRIPQYSST